MRMLIDARHPEETRVAVVKGSRIEEFDFESAEHKQLKGNIYLAKVTRLNVTTLRALASTPAPPAPRVEAAVSTSTCEPSTAALMIACGAG